MKLLEFCVVTPQESTSYQVEWVEVESPSGTFFVGFDHAPLISIVKHYSAITYKEPNTAAVTIISKQGSFFVRANKATFITDAPPEPPRSEGKNSNSHE